ncbi:MAG: HAD family phosphatase [Rhodoferax sp.]|nr:HAD family phosphatase [Rhodoferax sp.]
MNVVFDLGAVLLSWQPARLLRHYFPERLAGEPEAVTLAQQVFGDPNWLAFDRGALTLPEVVADTAARLNLPAGPLHALVRGIGAALTPLSDSVALLRALHVLRLVGQGRGPVKGLYYLSNMPQPYARYLLQQHDFFDCFDGGIFSADVGFIKPEPAIYQLLQLRHALVPGRTLLIDDLVTNVQAAQALGWHGVVFESAAQLRVELKTHGLLGG